MLHAAPLSPTQARYDREIAPADRCAPALLARRAAIAGDKPLVTISDKSFSAADMAERAGRTAGSLGAAGIGAGDRVAILCGNRIEFLDLWLGCAWLNAVAVPINRSSRGGQLQHILSNSGARLLVLDHDAIDVLETLDAASLDLTAVWVLSEQPPAMSGWPIAPIPAPGAPVDPVESRPSDLGSILYTSGTTGPSKGVCCPHAQMFWWGVNSIDILEIEASDVLLTTLPLFHVNALGTFYQALLSGATLVAIERFSAGGFVRSLRDYGATVTYLLGAMIPILLSRPEDAGDRGHGVRRALAPGVPAAFGAAFEQRFGIGLIEGYGSTETNFVIGDVLSGQRPGFMGRVRPGFDARVVDTEDNEVAVGEPGELVVRAAMPDALAQGYFQMPEATLASRRNLWFHTGDRVYRDADGYFAFMDRMKDAIRRRGENISAYEVEQVLLSHPAVAQAAVFPVPSELAEDEVMAALVLHDGHAVEPEALLDFCQPRMTYFSVPRFLLFADALPMTDNGKVQRFKLRETGVTDATWDRDRVGYQVRRPGRAGTA
ncbi:ATP-dependent acyl-CoA ligase [Sphingomonas sp.]|uniref:ATP-dependent acyl-CoA ligase n=1 Tax=Sphingomonas sp. TaxID=28214 RepID=UPI002DD6B1EA|nr:ATP-dependent acyl-CoA ligase [Sphingomonas sp.]